MTFFTRPMENDDLPQVNEIDREAFPTQWPAPNYQQELQNRIAHYIVLCDDSRPAPSREPPRHRGWLVRLFKLPEKATAPDSPCARPCYIVGFSGIWMMAGEAHITNIAVRRDYQGRGLGELLLVATIDLAASLNAGFITLEVRVSNLAARGLYEKYGFARTGVRRGYYLDNHEDAVIMSTQPIDSAEFREIIKKLREGLAARLGR